MKKILLFALTFVAFSATSFSQKSDWRIHPDDAEYKICGNFQTTFIDTGDPIYKLTEVNPVGFLFPIHDKYYGGQTNHGNIFFTFDSGLESIAFFIWLLEIWV